MKVILVSLLFFGVALANLSCPCGKRNAGRIVNGKETHKNEYPWMVAIQTVHNTFTYCGGTIITPWHVVTAAHCVSENPISDLILVVGAHDVNDFKDKNAVIHRVDQVAIHDKADLALIATKTEMTYNDFVGPACMPPPRMPVDKLTGQKVKAMGWGRYDYTRPNQDKVKKLREVDLEIIDPSNCNSRSSETYICSYTPGKDTFNGDSGGPLLWLDPDCNRYTLVGVVSSGPGKCGNSTIPSNNINIIHFKDWIEDNVISTATSEDAIFCFNEIVN